MSQIIPLDCWKIILSFSSLKDLLIVQNLSKYIYNLARNVEIDYTKHLFIYSEFPNNNCFKEGIYQYKNTFFKVITKRMKYNDPYSCEIYLNSSNCFIITQIDSDQTFQGENIQEQILNYLLKNYTKQNCNLKIFENVLKVRKIFHYDRLFQLSEFMNHQPDIERIWIQKKILQFLKKSRNILNGDLYEYIGPSTKFV